MKPLLTVLLVCSLHPVFSQHNYDSIFALKGYLHTTALLSVLITEGNNANELLKLNKFISAKGNETDKSLYGFMTTARRFENERKPYEQAEPILKKYLEQAKKLDNHYLQAVIYFNIGEYANTHDHHNQAFENKLYSLRELETDPEKKYYREQWMVHQIASEYYLFHDYTKTLQLCEAIYTATPKTGWDTWFMKKVGNLIGMSHLKSGNSDSAKTWFQKTNRMAMITNDSSWQGISIGNIGNVYFMQKNYKEAIAYYKDALLFCRPNLLWDNVAPFSCNLAYCYLMTGEMSGIPLLLDDAKQAISKDDYHTFSNFSKYFSVAEMYYRKTGNTALALQYADSLAAYTTKENEEFNLNKKLQAEAQLAYSKKELENEVDQQKIKQGQILLYGLCIAILLLGTIAVLLFKRQKLQHRLRSEELEYERQKANEELTLSITEIRDFTKVIKEKNELILQFMIEIDTLKQKATGISNEQTVQIEQLRQSAILTENDWIKFKQLFEKVQPGYLARLKVKYAGLTAVETRYLVFTKMQLDAKEISAMLGVDAEAIGNIRSEIKNKFNLKDEIEIEKLVNEV